MVNMPMPGAGSGGPTPPGVGVYNTATLNKIAAGMPAPSLVQQPQDLVFLGPQTRQANLDRAAGDGTPVPQQQYASMTDLMLDFDAMSEKEKQRMARKLLLAGYLDKHVGETFEEAARRINLLEVESAYGTLLAEAVQRTATEGARALTPEQILTQRIKYRLSASNVDESGSFDDWWKRVNRKDKRGEDAEAPLRDGKFTTREQIRDIWSASEARNLARATLQNALGRDPTRSEYQDFVAALQEAQRENPVTSRSTQTYEDGELTNTSTTTHGGVDPEQFAYQQARETPGYAEWNAVGTYLPVALNLLGSGVPGA